MLKTFWQALRAAVANYPGGITAVVGIIVALGARFLPGLHLTATELASVYAAVSAFIGVYVRFAAKAKVRAAVAKALLK